LAPLYGNPYPEIVIAVPIAGQPAREEGLSGLISQLKGVLDDFDFGPIPFKTDSHHIKPRFGLSAIMGLHICQGRFRELSPLSGIHGLFGITDGLSLSGLYFNENQSVSVFCDQIHLSQGTTKVANDLFIPKALDLLDRQIFSKIAQIKSLSRQIIRPP
jgi:hypothetical protein